MSKRFDLNKRYDKQFENRNKYTNRATTSYNNQETNEKEVNDINKNVNNSNIKNVIPQKREINLGNSDLGELKDVKLKIPVIPKATVIVLLISIFSFAFLLIFVTMLVDDLSSNSKLATGGYYAMRCPEVTVFIADKSQDYKIVDTKTIDFEDYIAGVVAAEVGGFNNIEVYKEFALAARTYFLANDNNSCSIESSDRKQVYKETSNSLIYEAVEETKGQVILTDGELQSVQYDAFCSIAVDNEKYTIKQANQEIPREWVDSQQGIAEEWKQGTCAGNHGNGLSQWGSYYLATERGYTFDQLIPYYLGNNVTISSKGFTTSIDGLEIKDTTSAQELHEKLGVFLNNHGSSIEELNGYIKRTVEGNGAGTRAGVVSAAVSLINYLYDGANVRIPYYWGGSYQNIGVNPNFGGQISPSVSANGNTYYYSGFDCSGFASWAIKNGGYKFSRHNTATFHREFSQNSCNVSDASCIGQPGDLINSETCHVQMIVAVDEASNKYYIAESTGSLGLIMRSVNMHSSNCGNKETRILHMDDFYNNQSNIDTSY